MRKEPRTPRGLLTVALGALAAAIVPLIAAFHWASQGWVDEHEHYPAGR